LFIIIFLHPCCGTPVPATLINGSARESCHGIGAHA
jgi:hypothetical protein